MISEMAEGYFLSEMHPRAGSMEYVENGMIGIFHADIKNIWLGN